MERQVSLALPGAAGMDRMQEIMKALRKNPPQSFGGLNVLRIRDYASLAVCTPGTPAVPFAGTKGDLVIFDLVGHTEASVRESNRFPAIGNAVAARPSGTEPKIKFYLFAVSPPCASNELLTAKNMLASQLDAMETDLRQLARN